MFSSGGSPCDVSSLVPYDLSRLHYSSILSPARIIYYIIICREEGQERKAFFDAFPILHENMREHQQHGIPY